MWGPLLRGKFGDRAEDISMAWLWSKLTLRRQVKGAEARGEVLGYPRGAFEPLLRRLREEIEARGGRVQIDRPAARIASEASGFEVTLGEAGSFRRGHDPRRVRAGGRGRSYDAVLATVPNRVFEELRRPRAADGLAGYLERLRSIEYHAALCLVLELDRGFSPFYWTNVADPGMPFVGLIEQERPRSASRRCGGRRFLYVANYTAQDDELLAPRRRRAARPLRARAASG